MEIYGAQAGQAVGGLGAYEAAINSANQINAASAQSRAQFGQGFGGGLLQGVGSMLAEGGQVEAEHFDDGGMAGSGGNSFVSQFLSGSGGGGGSTGHKNTGLARNIISSVFSKNKTMDPSSGSTSLGADSSYNPNMTAFGNSLSNSPGMAAGNAGWAGADSGAADAAAGAAADEGGGAGLGALLAAKGGRTTKKVDALVSPGEHRVPKEAVKEVAKGNVSPLRVGETFPGKPKVKGNSYSNDTLPKKLAAGDVIIPNKVMQSKDPERGAAEFVRAILAKKGKRA